MSSYPKIKRWLAGGATLTVFSVLFIVACNRGPHCDLEPVSAGEKGGGKAEAWTMFGGTPSRNMLSATAKGLPVEWSVVEGDMKNVVWFAELGSKAYGGPSIMDGRIFVGTNNQNPRDKKWLKAGKPIDLGIVMAFDQKDGKFLWQSVFEKLAAGRVVDWPEEGICSTPTLEGDRMYYVSNRCEVVCAKQATGEHIWKLDMIAKLGVFPHNLAVCSPLLVGDHLWVITANGVDEGHINVPAPRAPSFIKVHKKTGDVEWQNNWPTIKVTEAAKGDDEKAFFKRLVNRGDLMQHGQWSNPAYGVAGGQAQVIFPGGEGWLYSFDLDGKLLWKFDANPKDAEYELGGKGTRNDFLASPVIYKERVYIAVGQDPEHEKGVGHLWCIDMNKRGDVSPELVIDSAVWPPKTKANPNSAMVWHHGGFTDAETFKKTRRKYNFGRTVSTVSIKDDICYAAELQGRVFALNASTGEIYWSHQTDGAVWSSPYWADGKIYLGTDAGTMYVFEHGKKEKILAKNEMDNSKLRATPVAIGDTLYVMTENRLFAIRNKKE